MRVLVPDAARRLSARLVEAGLQPSFFRYVPASLGSRLQRHVLSLSADATLRRRMQMAQPWDSLTDVEALWLGPEVGFSAAEHAALLERLPGLRWIYLQRTGVEDLPLQLFASRGLALSNSGGLTSRWVAETIVACILADAKRIPEYARTRRAPAVQTTRGFPTLTVTVVGTGRIGSKVAELARPLGCTVNGLGRSFRDPNALAAFDSVRALDDGWEAATSGSDYLVLACPLTPETDRLVNRSVLAALPASMALVNLARPRLVDQHALLEALGAGRLRAAYVSRLEDLSLMDRLRARRLPNLFLTYNREANVAGKVDAACAQFIAGAGALAQGEALPDRLV